MLKREESNKLIAEFMGATFHANGTWVEGVNTGTLKACHVRELAYHKDWNWLMGVVAKIEEYHYQFDICTYNMVEITRGGEQSIVFVNELKNSKIQAAYTAVLQFITWYNESGIAITHKP